MKMFKLIKNGIIDENPTFRLVLGTCPTLAITTSAINGIGMGIAATFVLIGSNVVISALRKFTPSKVRMPVFVAIIAGFVTIVQMLLKAYVPVLDKALGIYIPLIVVNCIIMARAESFASKNPILDSAIDGLGMGIGFTLAITGIGAIREILGNGSIFGISLLGESGSPALAMILPPGGFLVYGLSIGLVNLITNRQAQKTGCAVQSAGCHGCDAGCHAALSEKEV
ncbi:MAG: electron transport complex subunit RsxE [Bacillota bacterium]